MNELNPSGLCQCGCGGLAPLSRDTDKTRGYVRGRPLRYISGHQHAPAGPLYREEDCGHDTPCWVWTRFIDSNGYGRGFNGTRMALAHRVVYERHRGTIPDGLVLDHLCRNPPCVNPAHLEPVTQAENCRRAGRITPDMVRTIRSYDHTAKELAERLGISYWTVCDIRRRPHWTDAA